MNIKKAVSTASAALIAFAGVSFITTPAFAAGNTIYLKTGATNGNGTEQLPYGTIEQAMQQANAGDTIKIVGSYVHSGTADVKLDKAVTIQGGELIFRMDRNAKVYLTKNVTFKDVSLKSRTESNSPFRIFANGHTLTMDNVSIVPESDNTAPTIYTGKVANNDSSGNAPKVIFKNTPSGTVLNGIVASDEGATANLQTVITLDEGVTIPQGNKVALGPNTADVSLTVSSTKIHTVDATGADKASVIFNAPGKVVTTHLVQVPNLALSGNTTMVLDGTSTLNGNVTVTGTSVLDVTKQQEQNQGTFTISGTAQGGGYIHINGGSESLLEIKGTNNEVNVVIKNADRENEPVEAHKYVESGGGTVTLSTAHQTPDCTFTFNSGVASVDCNSARKAVSVAVTKLGDKDSTILLENVAVVRGPFDAPQFFKHLVAELQKPENAHLVVLTEAGENQPNVEEGNLVVKITWKAQEVGTFKIENGTSEQAKPVKYSVNTTNAGQVVSYTVPEAPNGMRYANGVTAGKVELTGADRFAHVTLVLEDESDDDVVDKVDLVVSIAGTENLLFKVEGTDRKDLKSLKPADYFALLVDSLKANPTYVLLTDPTLIEARDGVEPMIEWQAKQVASLSIKDGDKAPAVTPFSVRTLADRQLVSYLVPPAPAGKKYQRNGRDVPVTSSEIILEGDSRFENVELELVDIVNPADPQQPGDKEPGDSGAGEQNPDPQQPGDDDAGAQEPADPQQPGDKEPGDSGAGEQNPDPQQPGDDDAGAQEPADPQQPGDKQPEGNQPDDNQPDDNQPGGQNSGNPNERADKVPETQVPHAKVPDRPEGDATKSAPKVNQPRAADKASAGMGMALPKTGGSLSAKGTDLGFIFAILMLVSFGVVSLTVTSRVTK